MRLVLAILVSVGLVLSAPFVGQVRGAIRTAFPGQFATIVGGLIAAGLLVALGAAVSGIRERRTRRFGLILLALGIAVTYSAWRAGPNPESNAVERFHFLQYGLITFLFYRAWRAAGDASTILLPALAGLIVSCAEEWLQWFIPNRVGELNDVLLNLVAITTGILFSLGAYPPDSLRPRLSPSSARQAGWMAAATVVALGLFVHVVHLGHFVLDEETGRFSSRYSRAVLVDLQQERAVRWQATPPPTALVRLSREDQYLTEGIQHVRERNRQWEQGNVRAAWLENRILERYFEPVLDTPSYEGPSGHRWPAEQRADAARRAGVSGPSGYVSGAYPYPIFVLDPRALWAGVIVLAVLCVAAARRAGAAERPPRR